MGKIAFLFPGQGAQKNGMGLEFYEEYPSARAIFDEASDRIGLDMNKLCFENDPRLNRTEYTQAALVVTCMAMEKVAREKGLVPDYTAGLSLGEYCAIASAGGMSVSEAVSVARQRGILMQTAVPLDYGAMAAVLGMQAEQIEAVLGQMDEVWIANYNCPGQIVITGRADAVEEAMVRLKEAGAKRCMRINTDGPFHSPLLIEASEKMKPSLAMVKWKNLQIPYVTNVTAQKITDIQKTPLLLMNQICSPVRWEHCICTLLSEGVDTFIEIGPGKTLTNFMRKIAPQAKVGNIEGVADLEIAVRDFRKE